MTQFHSKPRAADERCSGCVASSPAEQAARELEALMAPAAGQPAFFRDYFEEVLRLVQAYKQCTRREALQVVTATGLFQRFVACDERVKRSFCSKPAAFYAYDYILCVPDEERAQVSRSASDSSVQETRLIATPYTGLAV